MPMTAHQLDQPMPRPWFLLLTGFVAANEFAFVTIGNCPSSWALRRYFGLRGAAEQPFDSFGCQG